MKKIFISYASEDKNIAEQIYLALSGEEYDVFFDRTSLPPAGNYNEHLKRGVQQSDLFVFLISPDSVTEGSYALSELKFCKEKWKHPKNHVLPVIIRKTDFSKIPNYLKAVTLLEIEGNIPAEVANSIKNITANNDQSNTYKTLSIKVLVASIVGFIGLAASVTGILSFLGIPTVTDLAKKFRPNELLIIPKFSGQSIDIKNLSIELNSLTDKESCNIEKNLPQDQKNTSQIKVVCKNLEDGRNISYRIQNDSGSCYANGNGRLGEASNPIINCE